MGFADLHIHTIYSHDGTSSISAILKHVAENTELDVIAITDHDNIRGHREAIELAPHYGIEVIPGCEVSTADGHLLALFIDQPVPAGMSLLDTVLLVAALKGICIAPHPMARYTSSLDFSTIARALCNPIAASTLIGIEAFNGGLVYTRSNPAAAEMARYLGLAAVGNSDSHILPTIGHGSTEFPGKTAAELRLAIESRQTRVAQSEGLGGLAALRSWLPRFMIRKLGFVPWNERPDLPVRYVRTSTALLAYSTPGAG